MDFSNITEPSVLENFDFDSFLNPDADDYTIDTMSFAGAIPGDGVEAGGVDNP